MGKNVLIFKLAVVERCVEAVCREKRAMIALFHDLAVSHNQNHVRTFNGGEAVCHDKGGASPHHLGKRILNLELHTRIDRGGCLVENEHRRQREHHAGDAKKLLYAFRDCTGYYGRRGIIAKTGF